MFNFTKYSRYYYAISIILVVASLATLFFFPLDGKVHLKFGIEFVGGSNMQVEFKDASGKAGQRPTNEAINNALKSFNLGDITVQPTGENGAILKFKGVDETTHQQMLAELNKLSPVSEKSFQYVGPSIGQELRNKTQVAIALALLAITIYIAFAFRKVSKPVNSWKYGVASLIALSHDVIVPLGIFSILGRLYNVEVTVPIVAALLTILGFSVHDTIVIFDRIRENILRKGMGQFEDTVNWSLTQTLGRSVSTVLTVEFVLIALYFFGGETLKYFALALIIGITAGAYSSIFIASPLLVSWYKRGLKKEQKGR